jgi:hypothetical protein
VWPSDTLTSSASGNNLATEERDNPLCFAVAKKTGVVITDCVRLQMKKLDELASLLANPVLPKASGHWSGSEVLVASAPEPDPLRSSAYPRDREVLTEHALEVSYFFEVLRDPFYKEALIDQRSKIEFFGRLATAAEACLLEQPDATAHLVCAAVLREAYSMAKQVDKGEFDFLIVTEGRQIGDDPTLPGQRIRSSSIKETIEFFRGRGIQIHGTV